MFVTNRVKRFSIFGVFILIGLLLISTPLPATWAMNPQSPGSQGTVPTPPKPSGGDEGPKQVPTPTIPPSPYIAAKKKFDSSGGNLDLWLMDGHCVQIQILPGAFNEQVEFDVQTIEPYRAPVDTCDQSNQSDASSALCKTTIAYILKGWQAVGGEIPPTQKVAPYRHVICYTAADLQLADNDPSRFVIASYDEAQQQWVGHPTTVDEANSRVSASVDHLSWWALMVKKPPVSAEAIMPRLPETGGTHLAPPIWPSMVTSLLGLAMIAIGVTGLWSYFKSKAP